MSLESILQYLTVEQPLFNVLRSKVRDKGDIGVESLKGNYTVPQSCSVLFP